MIKSYVLALSTGNELSCRRNDEKKALIRLLYLRFSVGMGPGQHLIRVSSPINRPVWKDVREQPIFILVVWGPNIAAISITAVNSGWKGVVSLLRKFVIWKVGFRWYLLVILGIFIMGLLAAQIAGTLSFAIFSQRYAFLALPGNLIISGPIGEVLGWRGFALPRLLQRYSPLIASLILGSLWGLWHLPGFLASGAPQSGLSFPAFLLGAIALTFFTTWVFTHTQGNG